MIKCVDRELREVEDDIMKDVDKEIRESAQMIDGDRLNFGLVQVVYEWARNKVKMLHFWICLFSLNLWVLFFSSLFSIYN